LMGLYDHRHHGRRGAGGGQYLAAGGHHGLDGALAIWGALATLATVAWLITVSLESDAG
ncbi:MFS transporter, partial [Dickeya dadantii]|nr:MFS transporter [Dickeya dadantii]